VIKGKKCEIVVRCTGWRKGPMRRRALSILIKSVALHRKVII